MEYLSHKLTDYILKKEIIKQDSYDIYQYGFQCFLEISVSTICSIVIALLLHMLPECLFFFLLFIPMRSFSGGLHLKTYFSCFLASIIVLISTLLAVKYIAVPIIVSLILYIFFAILILVIGPVDHPKREVDSHDNHIFKLKTYLTVLFSLLTAIIFSVIGNAKYMFLQAVIFIFIGITALIGRILYKKN